MKDNLFEMLLNLFETSLGQLQKKHLSEEANSSSADGEDADSPNAHLYVKAPKESSMRILTTDEQLKLTKSSYQFLMRMKLWNILDTENFELILNQLQSSKSTFVNLQETKWIMRDVLSQNYDEDGLAFLDLLLYEYEDELTVH